MMFKHANKMTRTDGAQYGQRQTLQAAQGWYTSHTPYLPFTEACWTLADTLSELAFAVKSECSVASRSRLNNP